MSTTDRIAVIRGRLTAMDRGEIDWVTVWDHAPADLAWAVGEVDGLSASLRGALRDIAIHATRAERAEREVEHVKAVLAAERVILRQVLEERDGALRDRRDAERERDVQFEMACAASTSEREALERLDASRLREAGLHEAEMALQEGFESAIRERDEARAALAELVRHRHSWTGDPGSVAACTEARRIVAQHAPSCDYDGNEPMSRCSCGVVGEVGT